MRNKRPDSKDQTDSGRFSLRAVWSRVAGPAGKHLLVAGALSSVLASSAVAPPEPVYIPDPIDPPEMTVIKKELFRTPAGRQLLDFAQKNGIRLTFDPKLSGSGNLGEYDAETSLATLRPGLPLESAIRTLAHEIRHAWQDKVLGYDRLRDTPLSPTQQWVLNSYIEADACAFNVWITADRMARLHIKVPEDLQDDDDFVMASALADEMQSWHGLTPAAYRKIAVQGCFSDLGSYTKDHIKDSADRTEDIHDEVSRLLHLQEQQGRNAPALKEDIADSYAEMCQLPSEEAFEQWLRRFGGTSLDPAAPTSLQTREVTREDIFDRYPVRLIRGDMKKEDRQLFDATLPKLTAEYQQAVSELSDIARDATIDAPAGPVAGKKPSSGRESNRP